uniref:Uncharacterized protein n=1 Tax=Chromera velia CCMP2878 TaxID=1169474 RepID=A0A0G4I4F5_9ALVE|eukprot:Cvel_10905.t1-p1 / transcript=Cvel_10905.t1 / gene=Cvel_10905 / organism=Chromera_velia_CCMP2878 / gene_product=hypothetical protein / transcript_product=hypothetical protein / location=Cvel_scaffold669:27878-28171(-) / protein_length=98 / sequence_SO=supercontig / SO=protein_coding / is_pseudo=false
MARGGEKGSRGGREGGEGGRKEGEKRAGGGVGWPKRWELSKGGEEDVLRTVGKGGETEENRGRHFGELREGVLPTHTDEHRRRDGLHAWSSAVHPPVV